MVWMIYRPKKLRNSSFQLRVASCPMGQIVKITLKSQETQAILMVWVIIQLKKSRNSSNYNCFGGFTDPKNKETQGIIMVGGIYWSQKWVMCYRALGRRSPASNGGSFTAETSAEPNDQKAPRHQDTKAPSTTKRHHLGTQVPKDLGTWVPRYPGT